MIDVQKYLSNYFKGTKDPSLEVMRYFMEEYNNFEKEMKFIHIAGTNGKGSCTEMISNILVQQGYKTGKFMSPHLIEYNERISINGENITNQELSEIIEELDPKVQEYNKKAKVNITLFELETMIALLYFYRKKVDFVILETGLGGLYDCTNVITRPLVSIITSIGYDHMHILGNSLKEIAKQKAGIIKKDSNTVFIEQEQGQGEEQKSEKEAINQVFISECKKQNNKLHIIKTSDIKNQTFDKNYQYFDYKQYNKIQINLKGKAQYKNATLAIECIRILNEIGYKISEENLRKGLSTVIHKARMETINENPLIIYDGAHNEPAIINLQQTINMFYKNNKKVFVVSILKTKDYKKIIQILLEDKTATFIFTGGNSEERYVSSEELYNTAKKYKQENQEIMEKSLEQAIQYCKNNKKEEIHFIIGSFYIYSTIQQKIK